MVLLAVLLAGCGAPAPDGATPSPVTTPVGTTPVATPPTSEPSEGWERSGPDIEVTLYLTAEGALSPDPPSEGRFAADATVADATSSVGAFPGSPWLGPPIESAWRITGALLNAQVTIVSDGAAASAVGSGIEAADLYAWVGDADRLVTRNDEIGPERLAPGAKHTFGTSFFAPPGGLVIPAGGRVAFYALATYVTTPPGALAFRVGGADATKLTLRATPITLAPDPPVVTTVPSEGDLEGRPPGAADEGAHVARIPVDLAFDARGIRRVVIEVDPVAPDARRIDLDLFLLAPSGDALFNSLTEFESERILLYAPNKLDDGTYTILVRNTSQVPGGFSLRVTMHSAS